MTREIDFTDWAHGLSEAMVNEAMKTLESETDVSSEAIKEVSKVFLSKFIGVILFKTLHEAANEKPESKNTQYQHTMNKYAEMKIRIQDAVAAGFQGAMSTFAKKDVDYYCVVKALAEPPTNLVM